MVTKHVNYKCEWTPAQMAEIMAALELRTTTIAGDLRYEINNAPTV